MTRFYLVLALAAALSSSPMASAQRQSPDLIPAQQEAMKRLAILDGTWRGEATVIRPGQPAIRLVHTERVGTLLDGSIRLVEGRSYAPDGGPGGFNAFAVITFDPATSTYSMRSHAAGRAGDFPLTLTATGFEWSIAAGPGARIRHVATIGNGRWREESHYEAEGKPPTKVFSMDLQRVGDSVWPQDGAVPPKP